MIALDTGVLLAAEGLCGRERWQVAVAVLTRLSSADLILPAQALAEVLHVLKTDLKQPADVAGLIVARWLAAGHSADISPGTIAQAQDLAKAGGLALEDALILASAAEAGAHVLLSDDMAGGVIAGVDIINPFAPQGAARLDGLLGAAATSA